jgi:two-component system OmpR family sensor kinase/two-component system sensor histidine kinase QseC
MNPVHQALGPAGRASLPERVATWSMKRRFALIATFVLVTSIAFGGLVMFWIESAENDQLRDERLQQLAATLQLFSEVDLRQAALDGSTPMRALRMRQSDSLGYEYQIWSGDGVLLAHSPDAPASRPLAALSQAGFVSVDLDGKASRTFTLPSSDRRLIVQVAEDTTDRWPDIEAHIAEDMTYLLIPYAGVIGLAWLMLRRTVRAIEATANQLERCNPLDMGPVRIEDPPKELVPSLNAIDMLFARVNGALSSERQFTAVAAHEMRTPLAGLRAHAQLASSARDDAELQESLQAVRSGVDRVSHLLDQMLDLARLDALTPEHSQRLERVKMSDVCRAVLLDLNHLASRRQTQIDVRCDAQEIDGHSGALSMLLRNLLINAIAYGPMGATVTVSVITQGDSVVLTVDDAGPGIREADRQRAFERFNRLGERRVQGVGLGLSIVLSVVDLHGASIQLLDSPLGGLRVQVEFPPIRSASDRPA